MASLWAQERAEKLLAEWANDRGLKMKDLIAEAIDCAEVYGFGRGLTNHAIEKKYTDNG